MAWSPWETDGAGDGPVVGYRVVYGPQGADYNQSLAVDSNITTFVTVSSGLAADEFYDFAVVVVREGEGGAGPPSNKATGKTGCEGEPDTLHVADLDFLVGLPD